MRVTAVLLLAVLVVVCVPPSAQAATSGSKYLQLKRNRDVEKPMTLLRTTVTLKHPDSVYVQTDGTDSPKGAGSAADVYVVVDGQKATNDSLTDWRAGEGSDSHPFDAARRCRWLRVATWSNFAPYRRGCPRVLSPGSRTAAVRRAVTQGRMGSRCSRVPI
jgi:hypothetical protein